MSIWVNNVTQPRPDANLTRVIHGFFSCDPHNSKNLVLIGQVKQYFAYETQHQHGAFAMTGGFQKNLFSPVFGEDSQFDEHILGKKPPTRNQSLQFSEKYPPAFRFTCGPSTSTAIQVSLLHSWHPFSHMAFIQPPGMVLKPVVNNGMGPTC